MIGDGWSCVMGAVAVADVAAKTAVAAAAAAADTGDAVELYKTSELLF